MRSGVSGLAGQRKWTVIEQTNGYIGCHPAKRVSLGAVAIACGERDAGEGAICAGGRPLKGGVCEEGDCVFDSMIFASGKNAGMALEDSR